jgi:hypothetical protein
MEESYCHRGAYGRIIHREPPRGLEHNIQESHSVSRYSNLYGNDSPRVRSALPLQASKVQMKSRWQHEVQIEFHCE